MDYLTQSNFRTSVFSADEKAIRDFTKKMLGRIVFLYFVQKKGWLGATDLEYTDGKQDLIMQFYNLAGANDSFYNNYLKILFFDTLNKERTDDNFEMPDGTILKIPFLNGGLFDKEAHDDKILTFKSELFHNILNEDDPKYRGFLDFLNAFNFTIYEDSPDEQTVAVDPEMLGHIFENLLEDNKDKGAYYTPKEIVHYMCQESLLEYLKTKLSESLKLSESSVEQLVKQKEITNLNARQLQTIDKLLDTVKICDPAIGSGAFPMGLLQEITGIKEVIAYETNAEWKPAEVKENIIQNSIYGVDIEKGAVDIARLRFWLSLVVDEKKPKALPNLDYKIVVGNSLVPMYEGEVIEIDWKLANNPALKQSRPDLFKRINENIKKIYTLQHEFFHSVRDKSKLKLEIRNHKIELIETLIEIEKQRLVEKGINHDHATKKKERVEITERKLKHAGFSQMLTKLKTLKTKPDKPLEYFDWQLNFPEVLSENLLQNKNQSPEIAVLNKQIQALNAQIDAINKAIEKKGETKLIKLKLVSAQSQINITEIELDRIEKRISKIYGEISYVDKNIASEPTSYNYQINSINKNIEEINNRILEANKKLLAKTGKQTGFDIVIGNPPYVGEKGHKEIFRAIKTTSLKQFYKSKMDLFYFFFHQSLNLSKKKAIVSFITTNYYITADSALNLRIDFKQRTKPVAFINFNEFKIFDSALGQHNLITVLSNNPTRNDKTRIINCNRKNETGSTLLKNILSGKDNNTSYFEEDNIFEGDNFYIRLSRNKGSIFDILSKIRANEILLGSIFNINAGCDITVSKVTNKHLNSFNITAEKDEGVFVLSKNNIDKLNLNNYEVTLIKDFIKNSDVDKYSLKLSPDKLIYTDWEEKENKIPNIINHLQKYRVIFEDQKQRYNEPNWPWYSLHRPRELQIFNATQKIIVPYRSKMNNFGYYEKPVFSSRDIFFITYKSRKPVDIKFLLALLNSKLIYIWLYYRGKRKGETLELYQTPLSEIPIKIISKEEQQPFIDKVDQILTLKKSGKDTTDLEREIDKMVYELYGLTDEEIQIVEESVNK